MLMFLFVYAVFPLRACLHVLPLLFQMLRLEFHVNLGRAQASLLVQ